MQQLCWLCEKCTGGCRWSDHLLPVKNWVAVETEIYDGTEHTIKSFLVTDCPEFVQSPKMEKAKRISNPSFYRMKFGWATQRQFEGAKRFLKELKKDYTYYELADMLHISRSTIREIATGNTKKIKPETYERIKNYEKLYADNEKQGYIGRA